jgi:hypothetical protein
MNVIYLGSRGDYGRMYIYAEGYIDNVRLTVPGAAATPEPTFATPTETPVPGVTTKKPTLKPTTVTTPLSPAPTQSPLSGSLAMAALGLVCLSLVLSGIRKN